MFFKKKVEKPKNPIGLILYRYDEILKNKIGKIIKIAVAGGKISPKRNSKLFGTVMCDFEEMKESISKEKLKTDYRSDKARDIVIEMIKDTENIVHALNKEGSSDYESKAILIKDLQNAINEKRATIRSKLRDVESDYY